MNEKELTSRLWDIFCMGEKSGEGFADGYHKTVKNRTKEAETLIKKLVKDLISE